YISVLSAEKRADCEIFVETLLSDEVQSRLDKIGMYPVSGGTAKRPVSVFSTPDALRVLAETARDSENVKNLDKYLKFI
ncbi:MAG: hypothetical protein K2H43_05445, partial [Clostridia bacterium]|nr:hypothetical protein [Clostridia bacterium]